MKGILINGSPKRNGSASGVLLDDLRSLLAPDTETAVMAVTAAHPAASPAYTGMHWEPSPEEQKKLGGLSFLVLSLSLIHIFLSLRQLRQLPIPLIKIRNKLRPPLFPQTDQ